MSINWNKNEAAYLWTDLRFTMLATNYNSYLGTATTSYYFLCTITTYYFLCTITTYYFLGIITA